jgi:hypothetical protein
MDGGDVEIVAELRRRLEEDYRVRAAAYLVDRPSGGWESLATKEHLDLRLETLDQRLRAELATMRAEFRDQTSRLLRWMVPTIFAGMTVAATIVAAVR